jgi:hypothetical protein
MPTRQPAAANVAAVTVCPHTAISSSGSSPSSPPGRIAEASSPANITTVRPTIDRRGSSISEVAINSSAAPTITDRHSRCLCTISARHPASSASNAITSVTGSVKRRDRPRRRAHVGPHNPQSHAGSTRAWCAGPTSFVAVTTDMPRWSYRPPLSTA